MSGFSRRAFLHLSAAVTALTPISYRSSAQDAYPSRPIRLVVGFTPGTAADITARTFAHEAQDLLAQKIIVENKPGAGSALAAEYVARAAKDGYTLFLATLSIVTAQAMKPFAGFDLARDFAPISLLANGAIVLVVNPDRTCEASPI
jgi:tripartite-type tricarboxylate transporter receptor subunit TctC